MLQWSQLPCIAVVTFDSSTRGRIATVERGFACNDRPTILHCMAYTRSTCHV